MPKPNEAKVCYVYWIHINENINEGYIGVSNQPMKRFKAHAKSPFTVGNAIRKYRKQIKIHKIFEGTREECFVREAELRPEPNMGWNQSVGGYAGPILSGENSPMWKGGSYCLECGTQIENKGRDKRCRDCADPKRAQFKHGHNPWNAGITVYEVIHPTGKLEIVDRPTQFCEEHGLQPSNFRKVAAGNRKHTKGFKIRKMKQPMQ
jgi:predicted GIY-YIG superfamily endonuclease